MINNFKEFLKLPSLCYDHNITNCPNTHLQVTKKMCIAIFVLANFVFVIVITVNSYQSRDAI